MGNNCACCRRHNWQAIEAEEREYETKGDEINIIVPSESRQGNLDNIHPTYLGGTDSKRSTLLTKPVVRSMTSGTVTFVKRKKKAQYVRIYLSPNDKHTIYAPFDGTVSRVETKSGNFIRQVFHSFERKNGRLILTFRSSSSDLEIIAWFEVGSSYVTNTIKMNKKQGDSVYEGEVIGEIVVGSLSQLRLPLNMDVQVHAYDVVQGAKTIVAV